MFFDVWRSKGTRHAYVDMALIASAWSTFPVLLLSSSVPLHADDVARPSGAAVCARMGAAMLNTAKTPYTSTSTIAFDQPHSNKPETRTSETIFTGDAVFVKFGGSHWRKIGAEVGALQELVRKASSEFSDCRDLGSEQIGGSAVSVLSAHKGAPPSAYGTTTKLWIDKVRGVLVRSETETNSEEGSKHSVIDYKYGGVAAPQL